METPKSEIVKKAVEFRLVIQPVGTANAAEFQGRINALLAEGYDVFSSQSIGLDTGGGQSGAGLVNMVVTLVKYDYLTLAPAQPAA